MDINAIALNAAISGSILAEPEAGVYSFWPKCEVPTGSGNVCCLGQTGHTADITKPTRMTLSGRTSLHRFGAGGSGFGPPQGRERFYNPSDTKESSK